MHTPDEFLDLKESCLDLIRYYYKERINAPCLYRDYEIRIEHADYNELLSIERSLDDLIDY